MTGGREQSYPCLNSHITHRQVDGAASLALKEAAAVGADEALWWCGWRSDEPQVDQVLPSLTAELFWRKLCDCFESRASGLWPNLASLWLQISSQNGSGSRD